MKKHQPQKTSGTTVLEFLQETIPFKDVDEQRLKKLAKRAIIDFFPKETIIFQQDKTEVAYFYAIQKGGIKSYFKNNNDQITLKDFRGTGEFFGSLALIENTKANLNIETVEDTFCFLFPKEDFLKLIDNAPRVSSFFLRSLSAKLIHTAYAELREHNQSNNQESSFFLFSTEVSEIKTSPKTINTNETVQKAAKEMAKLHIGSLFVEDKQKIIGIITDKDLRTKVVAAGLPYETKVSEIMVSPVQKITSHATCFDALLTMMSQKIHHLAVEVNGEINGVITTHDIMVLQGTSPIYLFREIAAQREINKLYPLAAKIPEIVRSLLADGAKANNVTRMITIINDHILERLLTLLLEKHGKPPLPFCWILMGSEGRREQTFLTDQDNGLLLADCSDDKIKAQAQEYFSKFCQEAIDHLVKCGYPLCPGNIMATNPDLQKPLSQWKNDFNRWIQAPNPEEILKSTIFFDFRFGFGDKELAGNLREHLIKIIPNNDIFLYHMARECVATRSPLSFFKNFIVEKNGDHKNRLNLKQNGLVTFVNFARIMALKHGIRESNTISRLNALKECKAISPEFLRETIDAYEFIMQIRLNHQLRQVEAEQPPDNFINPAHLTDLEKQTLKEAFEVTRRMQNLISQEFHLGEIN